MPLPNTGKGNSLFTRVSSGKTQTSQGVATSKPPGVTTKHATLGQSSSPLRGVKMGNGASSASANHDGDHSESSQNHKKLIPDLRAEIKTRDAKILRYESELLDKNTLLEEKMVEISKLRAEVDKLQSVLQIKVHKDKPDILATIQENASMAGQESRSKKQGVSGESPMSSTGVPVEIKKFEKDFR